jgi:hypothetical protein
MPGKPIAGGEHCQAQHIGLLQSGTMHVAHEDGSEQQIQAGQAYVIDPGTTPGSSATNPSSDSSSTRGSRGVHERLSTGLRQRLFGEPHPSAPWRERPTRGTTMCEQRFIVVIRDSAVLPRTSTDVRVCSQSEKPSRHWRTDWRTDPKIPANRLLLHGLENRFGSLGPTRVQIPPPPPQSRNRMAMRFLAVSCRQERLRSQPGWTTFVARLLPVRETHSTVFLTGRVRKAWDCRLHAARTCPVRRVRSVARQVERASFRRAAGGARGIRIVR